MSDVVMEARALKRHYAVSGGLFREKKTLRAVDGVSFALREGETLAVVGESGCGKSTLSRAVLNLIPATGGAVSVLGRDITAEVAGERG